MKQIKTENVAIMTSDVEGHTKYLQGIDLPIMVNTIAEDNSDELKPSPVAEMHIGIVDGKQVVLITPQTIVL